MTVYFAASIIISQMLFSVVGTLSSTSATGSPRSHTAVRIKQTQAAMARYISVATLCTDCHHYKSRP